MRRSHGLSTIRVQRTKSRGTKEAIIFLEASLTALFNYASITFQLDSGKLLQESLIGLKLDGVGLREYERRR